MEEREGEERKEREWGGGGGGEKEKREGGDVGKDGGREEDNTASQETLYRLKCTHTPTRFLLVLTDNRFIISL